MIHTQLFYLTHCQELTPLAETIKQSPYYASSSAVLIKLYTIRISCEEFMPHYHAFREQLPNCHFFGMVLNNRNEKCASTDLAVQTVYFEATEITLLEERRNNRSYPELARTLAEQLDRLDDVCAVEMTSATPQGFYDFINNIVKGRDQILFFGAEAGHMAVKGQNITNMEAFFDSRDSSEYYEKDRFVVGDQDVYNDGVVLLVYRSTKLQIKSDCFLGWTPIGKELTITRISEPGLVETIDNIPAVEIYHKYLNVKNDRKLLRNICEFPLITVRNGFRLARIPPLSTPNGGLFFAGDVQEGEKYRFSYAKEDDLLALAKYHSEQMRSFQPEYLSLYICGNRVFFLRDKSVIEHQYYQAFAPTAIDALGNCEIYAYQGQGGYLNSSFVAVGMREGSDPQAQAFIDAKPITVENETAYLTEGSEERNVPLTERLTTLLGTITSELEEAVFRANEANLAKSQFLSNMSHEIRTPINTILGMNEMIQRETDSDLIREYTSNVKQAGETLLNLINDILDFSKIEAGKLELLETEYALSSLLNDLHALLSYRAEQKGLEFIIQAEPTLPSVLYGDEIRLKQIITNFLTNAIKYTPSGQVTLRVGAQERTVEEVTLLIEVIDTGIGIKEEDLPRLTAAFERIEEMRNRTIEGTGLGMSITVKLLHAMHSELRVDSVYGKGSTFSFLLRQRIINNEPLGSLNDQLLKQPADQIYEQSFSAPRAHLLVVDDTAMNLTVIVGLLKPTRVQIETAQSGLEALELCRKHHYDLIFLDHRMPGLDGIETLQRLKAESTFKANPVPVIALTANAISGARKMYLEAGFDDYLSKPVKYKALEKMVIKYLPPELVILCEQGQEAEHTEHTPQEELPAWIANLTCLDQGSGIANCGSISGYISALKIFADSVNSSAAELDRYFQTEDYKNFTIKVHALKSSARIIGAQELSDRAKRLEDAGNNGYYDEIKHGYPPLIKLYRSYAEKLSPLLKCGHCDLAAAPLEQISTADLDEAITSLRNSVEDYDLDTLNLVLQSLNEYQLPEKQAAMIEQVSAAAAVPDWDRLQSLLKAVTPR